jgi:hypothetical protein
MIPYKKNEKFLFSVIVDIITLYSFHLKSSHCGLYPARTIIMRSNFTRCYVEYLYLCSGLLIDTVNECQGHRGRQDQQELIYEMCTLEIWHLYYSGLFQLHNGIACLSLPSGSHWRHPVYHSLRIATYNLWFPSQCLSLSKCGSLLFWQLVHAVTERDQVFRRVCKIAKNEHDLRRVCPSAGKNFASTEWIFFKFYIFFFENTLSKFKLD